MSNTLIYIGLDDTDNLESRGTGHLARLIASELASDFALAGVTRHQLFLDDRIPYTAKNSSAAICLEVNGHADLQEIFERVRAIMLANLQPGSDPGLCLATAESAGWLVDYGRRAKYEVVTQAEAHRLANEAGALLEGLAGSLDGVIGALAAAGLAACGEDGRYILVGEMRALQGPQSPSTLLESGIRAVKTLDGNPVSQGLVLSDKLRPARRRGQPVLFVEWSDPYWQPLKLD